MLLRCPILPSTHILSNNHCVTFCHCACATAQFWHKPSSVHHCKDCLYVCFQFLPVTYTAMVSARSPRHGKDGSSEKNEPATPKHGCACSVYIRGIRLVRSFHLIRKDLCEKLNTETATYKTYIPPSFTASFTVMNIQPK